ncbi:MAG: hypothetical protein AAF203_00300 [Pseudomonadota bacterium]
MKKILFSILMLSLVNCSSGGGGESLAPLTDEQKDIAQNFAQELADTEEATSGFMTPGVVSQPFSKTKAERVRPSQKASQLKAEMNQVVFNGNDCAVEMDQPDSVEIGKDFESSIEVKNKKGSSRDCPIVALSEIQYSSEDSQDSVSKTITFEGSLTEEFEVLDWSSLYVGMDVTQFEKTGTSTGTKTFTLNGFSDSTTETGTGTIVSKKHGTITGSFERIYNMNFIDQDNFSENETITNRINFADFAVVGVLQATETNNDRKKIITYLINGEEVKKREFEKYFEAEVTSGIPEEGPNGIGQGSPISIGN